MTIFFKVSKVTSFRFFFKIYLHVWCSPSYVCLLQTHKVYSLCVSIVSIVIETVKYFKTARYLFQTSWNKTVNFSIASIFNTFDQIVVYATNVEVKWCGILSKNKLQTVQTNRSSRSKLVKVYTIVHTFCLNETKHLVCSVFFLLLKYLHAFIYLLTVVLEDDIGFISLFASVHRSLCQIF